VRFAVEESFKGVTATEITILAMNMKGTSCEGMAALARGGRYLVYAGDQESMWSILCYLRIMFFEIIINRIGKSRYSIEHAHGHRSG